MKTTIERKALADALIWAAGALPKNIAVPATAGIVLAADSDGLTIKAFDYERGHTARLDADVLEPGQVLASGKFLATVVAGMSGSDVTLSVEGQTLTITSGRSEYRTQLLDMADYPTLPAFPEPVGVIDEHRLEWLLRTVSGITSDDAGEFNTGIHFETDDRGLWAVGADGASTATRSIHLAVTDWTGGPVDVTVPAGGVAAAVKGMSGSIEVAMIEGLFGLRDGSRTVTMRTYSAAYLRGKWREVCAMQSAKAEHFYTASASELAGAVKRAGALADDRGAKRIALGFSESDISVSSSGGIGAGEDFVPAQGDHATRVGMNADIFAKALVAAGDTTVRIGVPGTSGPAITMRPNDRDDSLFVVMPMKLGDN